MLHIQALSRGPGAQVEESLDFVDSCLSLASWNKNLPLIGTPLI